MKKYQIIYADPPWRYGGRTYDNPEKRKPIEEYYPTMTFEQLKKLYVYGITDKNSLLFLWVVNSKLKECISVGEHWGFKYITIAFIWHKCIALLGNYTMSGCDICLLFKKGKIPQGKLKGRGIKQFYEEKVLRHSQKPNEIRRRIELLFPESNRIELFAREKTEGWDVWGNEVESDITL